MVKGTMRKLATCAAICFAAALLLGLPFTASAQDAGGSLTLFLSEEQEAYYAEGIAEFQETYPDVELVIDSYSMNELVSSQQKIKTQLMAGSGPDLLLFNSYGADDVYKLFSAGIFASLDEFMTEENGWDGEAYVTNVIDGGRFEGVQYVMPLSYQVRLALASREGLAEAGFDMAACTDNLSLMQEVAKLYDLDYSNRILADLAQFSMFPQLLDGEFLDYSTGELGVDSEDLRAACEAYSRMYEEENTDGLGELGFYGCGDDIVERRAYLSVPTGIDMFLMAAVALAAKETPVILPLGSSEGGAAATVALYAGIRANSENRQNAWNMLCILLDEDMQRVTADETISIPVRRSALDADIEEKLAEVLKFGETFLEVADPGEKFIEEYKSYLAEPEKTVFVSSLATSEFMNTMAPYYTGEAGYEECLEDFQEYARIYLTE